LGEWKYGAGRGHRHLVYLTISTGIGGGVIIDNRLLLGAHGGAAELGHITVLPDGPMCGCGLRGHLEAVAAGPAIARWVEEQLNNGVPSSLKKVKPLTAKDVGEAAKAGDSLAIYALERAGTFIGSLLGDYLHIFNPSVVIIGGGVSKTGDLLLKPMRTAMEKHVYSPFYLDDLVLTTAVLGDDVGLIGALALATSTVEGPGSKP
jgi:glucokinase